MDGTISQERQYKDRFGVADAEAEANAKTAMNAPHQDHHRLTLFVFSLGFIVIFIVVRVRPGPGSINT